MLKFLLSGVKLIAFLPLFYFAQASADIAVLIHGFDSNAMTWQHSGINQYLHKQGWKFHGVLSDRGFSAFLQPSRLVAPGKDADKKLYTVNLASRAPIEYQSAQLQRMIVWLNQVHPEEPIYLIGHSAGGLVARYTLVQLYKQQLSQTPNEIAALISIASPHLGTFRAIQAIDAVDEPFFCPGPGWSFMQSVFGDDDYDLVKESERLLYQLYPSRPHNLIFWLNQQPHPLIAYFSIIRQQGVMLGDFVVPGYSQDMNNVPAIKNLSFNMVSQNGHFLTPQDALTIHYILTFLES
jgi:pimeloyl-ACP methyl ester carboxylesterase